MIKTTQQFTTAFMFLAAQAVVVVSCDALVLAATGMSEVTLQWQMEENNNVRNRERWYLMATNDKPDFDGFFGQTKNVESLRIEINGAKALGKALRHFLLFGNPGLGKTTLAKRLAAAIGVKLHEMCGSPSLKPYHLAERAKSFQAFEMLFIDEIHATDHSFQEALQRLMTDGVVPGFEKDPMTGRMKSGDDVKVPPITLIGATDKPGKLLKALASRFGSAVVMAPYTQDEMKAIICDRACQLRIVLTDDAASKIASTCAGTPREAIQRLDILQNFAAAKQAENITVELVEDCLTSQGISEFGLGEIERTYLSFVASSGKAGAKLSTLESVLSADATYLLRNVEPKLQKLGLLCIDERRRLTLKGYKYVEGNCK